MTGCGRNNRQPVLACLFLYCVKYLVRMFYSELQYCDGAPYIFAFSPHVSHPKSGKSCENVVRAVFNDKLIKEEELVGTSSEGEGGRFGTHLNKNFTLSHM